MLVCRCGVLLPAGTCRLTLFFPVETFSLYPFHLFFKFFPFIFQRSVNATIQKHLESSRLLIAFLCFRISLSSLEPSWRCLCAICGFGLFSQIVCNQSVHFFKGCWPFGPGPCFQICVSSGSDECLPFWPYDIKYLKTGYCLTFIAWS